MVFAVVALSAYRRTPGTRYAFSRLIIVGVVSAAFATAAWMADSWFIGQVSATDDILVIAHRGSSVKAPENTLAAINQATEDKADWVEIDVQETADGEVIVFHDRDFMKLAAKPLEIYRATMEDLAEIDIGSWMDPEFANERVPTLREALEAIRPSEANLLIEPKYYGFEVDMEQRVVDIVEAAGMADRIAVMSLKHAAIEKIRALRPDWHPGRDRDRRSHPHRCGFCRGQHQPCDPALHPARARVRQACPGLDGQRCTDNVDACIPWRGRPDHRQAGARQRGSRTEGRTRLG